MAVTPRKREEPRSDSNAPAAPEVEVYTPERKAEFLLSCALDRDDYEDALCAVRAMGLDPAVIPHYKPPGV